MGQIRKVRILATQYYSSDWEKKNAFFFFFFTLFQNTPLLAYWMSVFHRRMAQEPQRRGVFICCFYHGLVYGILKCKATVIKIKVLFKEYLSLSFLCSVQCLSLLVFIFYIQVWIVLICKSNTLSLFSIVLFSTALAFMIPICSTTTVYKFLNFKSRNNCVYS